MIVSESTKVAVAALTQLFVEAAGKGDDKEGGEPKMQLALLSVTEKKTGEPAEALCAVITLGEEQHFAPLAYIFRDGAERFSPPEGFNTHSGRGKSFRELLAAKLN